MNRRVVFRLDANSTIGLGHFVRCESIALGIQPFKCVFVSLDNLTHSIQNPIDFIQIKSEEDFFEFIQPTDIVVLDGYQFNSDYHKKVRALFAKLVVIDDLAEIEICADAIINHTPSLSYSSFKKNIDALVFSGLDYALLRNSFLQIARKRELSKVPNSILICFGGADPLNKTAIILETLLNFHANKYEEIHVVLGAAYTSHSSLEVYRKVHNIHFYENLPENTMAALMEKTVFAILPCSGILLEGIAAQMKIISGFYVENQKFVYQHHLELGSFVDANDFSSENLNDALNKLNTFEPSKNLIDGLSMTRVKRIFDQLLLESECTIRVATKEDTDLTFTWANDPTIRKHSFNKNEILFDDHQKWFYSKIQSPDCWYGIFEHHSKSIGSIRFDLSEHVATISYLLDPLEHGKGYGSVLLKLGLEALSTHFSEEKLHSVRGFVLPENTSSIKAFERFGFTRHTQNGVYLFEQPFKSHV